MSLALNLADSLDTTWACELGRRRNDAHSAFGVAASATWPCHGIRLLETATAPLPLPRSHALVAMLRASARLAGRARGYATAARDPSMSGCLVNLVTPFKPGTTEIDYPKLAETTERQVRVQT